MADIGMLVMLAAVFTVFYGFMHWCGNVMDEETKEG